MSTSAVPKLSLAAINDLSSAAFVTRLGGVFEHSPWIAEAAAADRPFASLDALHAAMAQIVETSSAESKLALIRAHPDLAGRLAQQGQLTRESTHEQASAGLHQVSAEIQNRLTELNETYRARFQFPFIICARLNNVETILSAMEQRLTNERPAEISTALTEIAKIARLRLEDLIV